MTDNEKTGTEKLELLKNVIYSEEEVTSREIERMKIFLVIQVLFLLLSGITGGFHFKLWSMLDTALMIQSIGISVLTVVLDTRYYRKLAFKVSVILYILSLIDMGINVLLSGVAGWRSIID